MTTIEKSRLSTGENVFRWACSCGARGVWLLKLDVADRNGAIHARSIHARAVA